MSRKTSKNSAPSPAKKSSEQGQTKLALLLAELGKPDGATIDELANATGWQKHSVRGAMAGSLKRKGHVIVSALTDGVRRYTLQPSS